MTLIVVTRRRWRWMRSARPFLATVTVIPWRSGLTPTSSQLLSDPAFKNLVDGIKVDQKVNSTPRTGRFRPLNRSTMTVNWRVPEAANR